MSNVVQPFLFWSVALILFSPLHCICHTYQSSLQFLGSVRFSSVAQSCPTLCDPMSCSPPGSSVHAIFLARILEWVTFPSSRGSSPPRDQSFISCTVGGFLTCQVALMVRNLPANARDARGVGLIPDWGRSPAEEMATNSRILAWEIP